MVILVPMGWIGLLQERMSPTAIESPQETIEQILSVAGPGRTIWTYDAKRVSFAQGDSANSLFYVQKGKIKITVLSKGGKVAVIALLGVGDFFGEGCLTGQTSRPCSATAQDVCSLMRLEKASAVELLHLQPAFSERFLTHMLKRTVRIEEALVDQLFNSCEKRLARTLLMLANFGTGGEPENELPGLTQETLADMIGTTRSRVSFFMNKFRRLGYVKYNGTIEVHSSLLTVLLHD